MDVFPYSKNTFIPCFVFATIALHVWFLGQNISEWVPPTIFGGPWSFHNVFRIYLTMMKRFECQPFSQNPQYFSPKAYQTFPKIESWWMWHETYWCIWSLTGACRERGKGRRDRRTDRRVYRRESVRTGEWVGCVAEQMGKRTNARAGEPTSAHWGRSCT